MPLVWEGEIVGGIRVSRNTRLEDEDFARAYVAVAALIR
jgi:hypothetical protein